MNDQEIDEQYTRNLMRKTIRKLPLSFNDAHQYLHRYTGKSDHSPSKPDERTHLYRDDHTPNEPHDFTSPQLTHSALSFSLTLKTANARLIFNPSLIPNYISKKLEIDFAFAPSTTPGALSGNGPKS
ncbi:MAG: hypothetical protein Q8835_02805 [Sweet potato little leaf phytoplasma]|nr:hypothetical protein [Sweet potato little leaf phytoplasma]